MRSGNEVHGDSSRGFTLVEVLVALLVLAVATAATTEITYRAASVGREADHRERILWEITRVADSLAREPAGGPGSLVLRDGTVLEWETWGGGGSVSATPPLADTSWISLPVAPREGRTTLGTAW